MEYNLLLIRYGEIALKSKETRKYFENILIKNIKNALDTEEISGSIRKDRGRIYLYSSQLNKCIPVIKSISGITSFSLSIECRSDINSISELAIFISKEFINKEKSFALRVNRFGEHDYSSQDIAVRIGHDVVSATGAKVNLTKPDFELYIDIRNKYTYFFMEKIQGIGGLPRGTQGNALAIIVNPRSMLAAWYIMNRGCNLFFANTNKGYTNQLKIFLKKWYINSEPLAVNPKKKNYYEYLNKIASEKNCDVVVTGHSLTNDKQNEFQELKFLKKQIKLPILHPLVAMELDEINQKCLEIGISS